MSHRINIVIVDDHPIVIQGLKMTLENERNFHITGTFTDGSGLRSYIKTNKPDIIFLDITLPDYSGIDLCAEVKKKIPEACVIMFSNRTERSIIMQCLQNGASGFLLKNSSIEELRECIKGALSGNIVFCKEVSEIIQKPIEKEWSQIPRLTKRENEILKLLTQGFTSIQIAESLYLSPLTVDTHRKNILQKCNVKNTPELIQLAVKNDLV